jgi:hypothetical protein
VALDEGGLDASLTNRVVLADELVPAFIPEHTVTVEVDDA